MESHTAQQTEVQSSDRQQQQQQQPQQTNRPTSLSSAGTKSMPGSSQPLLALSGLGLAYGSLKSVMRRIKRATTFNSFKLPKTIRTIPKCMRNNYVRYPILFMVLLAAVRRVRAAINH